MPVASDVYSLPPEPNQPDNAESADAVMIMTILNDLVDGINYAINYGGILNPVSFADLTGLPTTLAGYGITNGQTLDATLTAFAAITFAADKVPYGTGADAFSTFTFDSYMRGLMSNASEAAFKTAINNTSGLAQIAAINTFTAAQRTTLVTLTDGATVTPDFALGNDFVLTLGGNRTLANPTNLVAGQSGSIRVIQDGTGSRLISSWGSFYKFTAATAPTLSTGAGSTDVLHYKVWTTSFIEVSAHLDVR